MSSLACAPNALADQREKEERSVSKIGSLKSELLLTNLQPCAPGRETTTFEHKQSPKIMATKINFNERGERGKSDACLFSQLFEFSAIIRTLLTGSFAVCPGKSLSFVAAKDY